MAKYDLTSSLEKDFTFSINAEEFVFRKPTVREMRALAKKFAAVNKEEDSDKQMALSDEAMEELYRYVENVDKNGRKVTEALDEQPVDVQVLFNEMIQKELGVK